MSIKNIVVGIPTYNRHKLLKRLLSQINTAAKSYNVTVLLVDDGSTQPVDLRSLSFDNISRLDLHRFGKNNGKTGYWKTVNSLFDRMREIKADYYFYLGDDLQIDSTFFESAISTWDAITDENKISLNLLNDGRTDCWTKFKRVSVSFGEHTVFKSQWLDMVMMFDEKLLEHRIKPISKSRWYKRPNLSSGVGHQLSIKFHNSGKTMYQVKNSLVHHGGHISVMNPQGRRRIPLKSLHSIVWLSIYN